MGQLFHVVKRDNLDWVVVTKHDFDENGNLKKNAEPVSRNHSTDEIAKQEADKLENKFGDWDAGHSSR